VTRRLHRYARIVAVLVAVIVSACSHVASQAPAAENPVQHDAATPQEWKPGSHASAVLDRILRFRMEQRAKFERFMQAYGASHGDVSHPVLSAMRADIVKWFGMSDSDYTDLPVYMKAFEGTGPYRRAITKPGYSYVAGTVFLPCNAAHLNPKFETAFAYVGGWGTGRDGKAVDAGFQYSNTLHNYAAFIRAQGFQQISKEPRFVCGHPVDFDFYAASDTELRLRAKGLTENKRIEVVEANLQHQRSYGWPADGGGTKDGIVLKRMTTIGQNDATSALPKGVSWYADGSYFGHYANDRQPRIHWWNLVVGRVDAKGNPIDLTPWGVSETDETPDAGMFAYPSDPRVILFTCTGCSDETDGINLGATKP
jgi:hypothetical protein